ncbi:MAG TPA: LacI family DNA-binding transcriptional regulator [Candidatus Binatia bacterium]|nr:LacI family DNA-binding transcriptional regulator [Candidatus Binatia bacterium]
MSSKRVTLRDLAKKLGVSHTTVSLALRDHPSILPERRAQIKRLAEKEGYRPDPFLSALSVYRLQNRPASFHSTLAWVNHWDQPEALRKRKEFDAYWRGGSQAAEKLGYRLEDIRWPADISAKRFEQILVARGIQGILIPPHPVVPVWGDFDWNKFSIIRLGLSVPEPDSHVVTSDHQRAVLMAFEKMSRYGYQRIGLVVCADWDRHLGGNYIGGFAAAQRLFKFQHILPPLLTNEPVYLKQPARAKQLLGKWLEQHQPDAILSAVVDVPPMIRELGHRIPEDIAVAGSSRDVIVDAGINQNPEDIGRIAVQMLVSQINLSERGVPCVPCRTLVESAWQDGASLPPRPVRVAA